MSTSLATASGSMVLKRSNLTQQLDRTHGDQTPRQRTTSPKPRSFSDATKPTLSPSPAFRESQVLSKDDTEIYPSTPRRNPHMRGLSLQMPHKEDAATPPRIPVSPKLEASHPYGSPASMLPRHSRGLDFARACTNLHLSTLADATPEASPGTGRAMQIPPRKSQDSSSNSPALWTVQAEKSTLSSSVSSVNMLESDSDSDSSADVDMDREIEDPMLNTPAASRPLTLFTNSPGMEWNQSMSAQSSLLNFTPNIMSYRRSKWKKGKSHNSSSSVSMRSSRPSPGPTSPPIMKSVENESYFGLTKQQIQSRRESLSLGTDDLHLSDSEENENKPSNVETPQKGVIRRAVTRRSNMLPKTKGFARIKAALLEESAPIESEARREGEVVKQVHENDSGYSRQPSNIPPPTTPLIASPDEEIGLVQEVSAPVETFSQQAQRHSGGPGFWNAFDQRYRTPPPSFTPRESSSAISDEALETIATGDNPAWRRLNRSRSRSTTPLANGPTAQEVAQKANKKRRRDDDFDPASFKRRAVSPGMSVQSSPVLPQSPVLNGDKAWGRPPPKQSDRSNSNGSTSGGVKRIGAQGMNETNEGLMSMSID